MGTIVGPVDVVLTSTTLPGGYCPTTEQGRLDTYAAHLTGLLPGGYSTIVSGNSLPSAIDQDKPWLRYNADGTIDRWYTFAQGAWLSPHLIPPGFTMLYPGDITSIATFDGGSVGAVTVTTGPFWEEVTAAVGRVPIHPDPSKTVIQFQDVIPTGTAVVVGSTGGEERHTLTSLELPDHQHKLEAEAVSTNSGAGAAFLLLRATAGTNYPTLNPTNTTSNDQPHNNMPPFYGIYLIRRTARLYYRQ